MKFFPNQMLFHNLFFIYYLHKSLHQFQIFCCFQSLRKTEIFESLAKFIPSLLIQNLLQKTNCKCNENIYICIYSFSYMLHMQHSIIFPVLFYLNLHFSLLIRVIQNPSIITIFTIHIPKIHSFAFRNCFISFP